MSKFSVLYEYQQKYINQTLNIIIFILGFFKNSITLNRDNIDIQKKDNFLKVKLKNIDFDIVRQKSFYFGKIYHINIYKNPILL